MTIMRIATTAPQLSSGARTPDLRISDISFPHLLPSLTVAWNGRMLPHVLRGRGLGNTPLGGDIPSHLTDESSQNVEEPHDGGDNRVGDHAAVGVLR